jgi:hypothetical protein
MMFGGYKDIQDMFDGGGPGRSGSQFEGGGVLSDIGNAMGGPAMFGGGGEGGGLMSSLGGLIGMALGGPAGAALGSGLGSLASGGGFKEALTSGVTSFGLGSLTGMQGLAMNPLMALTGGTGADPKTGLGGGIMGFAQQNPLVMAALMQAFEPSQDMLSPTQKQQLATGERLPDYRGTAAPDYRMPGVGARPGFAVGGYIQGPGTGTSDSIPARIYQNGGPVQEAMLSDGEFVMTERAVRGAGGGDRNAGAAKMYEMMSNLERRA